MNIGGISTATGAEPGRGRPMGRLAGQIGPLVGVQQPWRHHLPCPLPAATGLLCATLGEMVDMQPLVVCVTPSSPFDHLPKSQPKLARQPSLLTVFEDISSSAHASSCRAAAPKSLMRSASRKSASPAVPVWALANPSRKGGKIQAAKYMARSMPISAKPGEDSSNVSSGL